MTLPQQGKRTRGRPPSGTQPVIVQLTLTLHPGEDDDLIELYRHTPRRKRSAVTKMAMRAGGVRSFQAADLADDEADAQAAAEFLL